MFPTTPVVLVLGLTIATCVIAYWSDNLGKKLGKKRLSLFGLRPRQTATLISMVTSVGIMLLTLLVMLVFNSSLRNALLNYDNVRRAANRLTRTLSNVKAQAQTAEKQLRVVSGQLDESRQQLNTETKNANAAKSLTAKARVDLDKTRQSLKGARTAEVFARRGQNAARQGEKKATAAQVVAQQKASVFYVRLTESTQSLNSKLKELAENAKKLDQGRVQLHRVRQEIKDQKDATQRQIGVNKRQIIANKRLVEQSGNLEKQIRDLQDTRKELLVQIDDAKKSYEVAQQSFIEANAYAKVFGGIVGQFGAGKIAANLGRVFAETTLPPASDPARIRVAIRELLDRGAPAAVALGAKPFQSELNSAERVLQLAPRYTGRPGQEEPLTDDEQIDQLANYLSTFKMPVSMRAVAARNYAEGETNFFARIELVPIKRVFVTGETITSSTVDGNATDAELFNKLLELVNAGEAVARQRGMAPLVTTEHPNFYADGTNERIFDALRAVQMQVRQVRVRLVAVEDFTTVDNLRIRFVIERMGA